MTTHTIHIDHQGRATLEAPKATIGHALARAYEREGMYGKLWYRHKRLDHVEYEYARGRVLVHDRVVCRKK